MENIFLIVLFTVITTSICWFFYIKKFLKKEDNKNLIEENDQLKQNIKDQENEIKIHLKEIESIKMVRDTLKESLKKERETTARQFDAIEKVEDYKKAVENTQKDNTKTLQEYTVFVDKLTGNSKYQGKHGEKFLEKILQLHGYKKGINYAKHKGQEVYNFEDETSSNLEPDIIIFLTDDLNIVCDSKVSLDNWKKFVLAKDEDTRNKEFAKHADSVKRHIDTLAKKNYTKILNKQVFKKTIMFLPHEASYLAALEKYPDLDTYASKKNVIFVGPGNLLAVITLIDEIRTKDQQIDGVMKITENAENVYNKYATLKSYLVDSIKSFNSHGINLQKVINSAWSGKGNLEQKIEDLKDDHGLHAIKSITKTTSVQDKVVSVEDSNKKKSVN